LLLQYNLIIFGIIVVEQINKVMRLSNFKNKDKLELVKLEYSTNAFEPVLEEENINYHYNVLSKGYVDRFNAGEGDIEFNRAGALLHNIWWPQLKEPKTNNKPTGSSKDFIETHFGSWEDFRDQFTDKCMYLQGSGWVYLAKNGEIKTIQNHQWKTDIIFILDCWEHAMPSFTVKKDYIKVIWRLIDWTVISDRINLTAKS